jgi:hypothetical protein
MIIGQIIVHTHIETAAATTTTTTTTTFFLSFSVSSQCAGSEV